MLPKDQRLKKAEIEYILKKGQDGFSKLFIFKKSEKTDAYPRFAIITSQKLAKKAVARNRLRRKIYAAIRTNLPLIKNPKLDFVLIPKKKILNSTFQEIAEDITRILTWTN